MDNPTFTDSVEELRLKLEAMKRLIEKNESDQEKGRSPRRESSKSSLIDGSLLSFVFGVVLIAIIVVSVYAFSNLYYAILKKYSGKQHSEL